MTALGRVTASRPVRQEQQQQQRDPPWQTSGPPSSRMTSKDSESCSHSSTCMAKATAPVAPPLYPAAQHGTAWDRMCPLDGQTTTCIACVVLLFTAGTMSVRAAATMKHSWQSNTSQGAAATAAVSAAVVTAVCSRCQPCQQCSSNRWCCASSSSSSRRSSRQPPPTMLMLMLSPTRPGPPTAATVARASPVLCTSWAQHQAPRLTPNRRGW